MLNTVVKWVYFYFFHYYFFNVYSNKTFIHVNSYVAIFITIALNTIDRSLHNTDENEGQPITKCIYRMAEFCSHYHLAGVIVGKKNFFMIIVGARWYRKYP